MRCFKTDINVLLKLTTRRCWESHQVSGLWFLSCPTSQPPHHCHLGDLDRVPGQAPPPESKEQRHPRGPLGPGTHHGGAAEVPRREGFRGLKTCWKRDTRQGPSKGQALGSRSHGGLERQCHPGVPPRQADAAEGLRLGLETGRCRFCRGQATEASGLGPRGSGDHMSQEGGLCHHSQQHQEVEQEGPGGEAHRPP